MCNVLFVTSLVTNWMTATGIALIAGGLATLICFRRVLWSGPRRGRGATQRRMARTRVAETAPRLEPGPAVLPAQGSAPEISGAHLMSEADESEGERPEEDAPETTGDYWMPVPESAYAELDSGDYDWPARNVGKRAVESEPTAVVPTWPPARPFDRIELPRTWSEGPSGRRWDEANRNLVNRRRRHQADEVAGRPWEQLDRDGGDGWRRRNGSEEEHLTLRRPQPRPNPTVYVSRHAAE